jgi:hypothetical protein
VLLFRDRGRGHDYHVLTVFSEEATLSVEVLPILGYRHGKAELKKPIKEQSLDVFLRAAFEIKALSCAGTAVVIH